MFISAPEFDNRILRPMNDPRLPLCTFLEVTLNELFAGECIAEDKLKEKADEVLMDVIANWLGDDNREKVHSKCFQTL